MILKILAKGGENSQGNENFKIRHQRNRRKWSSHGNQNPLIRKFTGLCKLQFTWL